MFDVILKNGTVIDGTNSPRFRADVAWRDGRIAAIGELGTKAEAREIIDAAGRIVAPGFVDVHNHSEGWLLKTPNFISKTAQGFTTEVLMSDGISYAPVNEETWREWVYYLRALDALRMDEYRGWKSIAEFMSHLDGRAAQNSIAQIPYANVRTLFCGFGRKLVDDFQMRLIRTEIAKAMDEGAAGLSTGLDYIVQCFSTTDELVAACEPVAKRGGLYVTHIRYKTGLLPALQEAVEIGRRSGVKIHISHLKATTTKDADEVLSYIDNVARKEVDFSFDVYPYLPGSTMLSYLLPYEVWEDGPLRALEKLSRPEIRARFAAGLAAYDLELDKIHIAWVAGKENSSHHGQLLSEFVAQSGKPAAEALIDLLIEERMAVLLVFNQGDDRLVAPFLQHDLYMMGSDGIYHPDSRVHPRQYGSAPRLLGAAVRDHRWFTLEAAVHKLSGVPCARFGLKNRGEIREGNFADVVVFDPETVGDPATHADPHRLPTGISEVFVNGTAVIHGGNPVEFATEKMPGRALRFGHD